MYMIIKAFSEKDLDVYRHLVMKDFLREIVSTETE